MTWWEVLVMILFATGMIASSVWAHKDQDARKRFFEEDQ